VHLGLEVLRPAAVAAQPRAAVVALHAALGRAGGSALLSDYLGSDFVRVFMAVKRAECERFNAEPTTLDYDWYLRLA